MKMRLETVEESDRRREASMAAASSLRPNLILKKGPTEDQLRKFQELHKRRLKIKAKSKSHKKDVGLQCCSSPVEVDNLKDQEQSVSVTTMKMVNTTDDGCKNSVARKRQKLYWGLDTKERWERKANM